MNRYYTVNGCGERIEGTFKTLGAAISAWIKGGRPRQTGSSVWVTEYLDGETVQTITISV